MTGERHPSPMIGTMYYRPPSPPAEEWEADFKQMRAIGFDAVKMWLYWGWHERRPGRFDWRESDRFFDLAERHRLMVIPNIILELPPSWLKVRHALRTPEATVERSHFPSIPIPCFDDPMIRRKAEPFVRALVRRYRDRRIVHWDVWNEPRSRGTCVCDASRARYARWLRGRFKTVENYNRIFGKCFHDWDAVARRVKSGADYADEFNWRLWAAEQLADQVEWVARIVKSIDRRHPVMCHVGSSSPIQSVRSDTCVDALMMRGLDLYGSSCDASWESQAYTAGAASVRGIGSQCALTRAQIQIDWMRSLSPKNWICELYADLFHPFASRQPAMLLWQLWQIVSRGLAGIMIWEYKSERIGIESLGYGLVGLDGRSNERSDAVASAIRLIRNELTEFFRDFAFAEPTVGILYDERSHLISEMDGAYKAEIANIHIRSLWGLYETLRRRNVPVRLVPHQHLADVVRSLTTLILPGHGYMDPALAAQLTRFVADGGHVIGQAGVGFRRENTWVSTMIPSHGLAQLFGIGERSRKLVANPLVILSSRRKRLGSLQTFRVDLECRAAAPLAWFQDGSPAITSNRFGRGRATYIGGYLGLDNADAGQLVDLLELSPAPRDPLSVFAGAKLDCIPWRRKGVSGTSAAAYFVFNTSGQTIVCAKPRTGSKRLTVLFGSSSTKRDSFRIGANSAALLW